MNIRDALIGTSSHARLSIKPSKVDLAYLNRASTACATELAFAASGGRSAFSDGRDSPPPVGTGGRAARKQRRQEERMRWKQEDWEEKEKWKRKVEKWKRRDEEKRRENGEEQSGREGKRKGKKGKRARGKRKKR